MRNYAHIITQNKVSCLKSQVENIQVSHFTAGEENFNHTSQALRQSLSSFQTFMQMQLSYSSNFTYSSYKDLFPFQDNGNRG